MKFWIALVVTVLLTATAFAAWVPNGGKCPKAYPIKAVLQTYVQSGAQCEAFKPGDRAYAHVKPGKCYATMEDAIAEGCHPANK